MRKKRTQPEGVAPPVEPKRVTPVEIQQKEFRLAMRGYNERDVDQFLDEVTEEVARLYADNKRLREEVDFGRTTRFQTAGAGEAEGMIRQAREEAARIIAEATARASTIGSAESPGHPGGGTEAAAPPTEIMGIFLARERAFLQNMANLIQAHAEGVKQDVRRVREQVGRQVPAAQSQAASPAAASSTTEAEARAQGAGGAEEIEPDEAAITPPAGEPTQAWEVAADEGSLEEESSDIVDLTEPSADAAEGTADTGAEPSGQPSKAEAALSGVYERAMASRDPRDLPGHQRENAAGARPGPRVEEDDAKEDRSIRELFWGED